MRDLSRWSPGSQPMGPESTAGARFRRVLPRNAAPRPAWYCSGLSVGQAGGSRYRHRLLCQGDRSRGVRLASCGGKPRPRCLTPGTPLAMAFDLVAVHAGGGRLPPAAPTFRAPVRAGGPAQYGRRYSGPPQMMPSSHPVGGTDSRRPQTRAWRRCALLRVMSRPISGRGYRAITTPAPPAAVDAEDRPHDAQIRRELKAATDRPVNPSSWPLKLHRRPCLSAMPREAGQHVEGELRAGQVFSCRRRWFDWPLHRADRERERARLFGRRGGAPPTPLRPPATGGPSGTTISTRGCAARRTCRPRSAPAGPPRRGRP